MKTMKNWLLTGLMFLIVSTAFAQGKVTGTVTDGKGSLPGANIVIKGTKIAVSTDFDGKFSINTTANSGELVVSFIGYKSKTVKFNGAASVGTIALVADDNQLQEIVVRSSVVDVAKDRKTPVAVSTIRAAEIQEKLGSQEFPEILANTPSVYATKAGGGFGDSRINIRGFDQKNIAVLINGVPVNDMENSAVYWSNWAGLSDVTSAMQVQRGLGSSKLAISSVGGTINVVTRSADMKEGGSVSVGVANDNYLKKAVSYSTGLMKNGLSTSILLSQTTGDGYIDGTKFEGGNYFIGIGYKINAKHDLEFTITGAPQWHNQRSTAPTIAQFIKYGSNGEPNRRYNNDWGILNGQEYNFRTNYYHKPIASINWDYKISDKTKLSTVVYGSWGRGGGSNGAGAMRGNRFFSDNLRFPNGIINVDLIKAWNSGQSVVIPGSAGTSTRSLVSGAYQNSSSTSNNTTNGITKISSINSHNWYGGVVNLNTKLSERFTLDFGIDARTYRGIHYQNIVDMLGSTNYADNTDVNNPNRVLTATYAARPHLNPFFNLDYQSGKINYNNDGLVNWYGAFTQLEYSAEKLTAFFQGSVSNQGFRRDDYFLYLTPNPLSSTDYKNLLGGNVKGGANYNINDNHNVFVNAGYYSKQPFFSAVYPNNKSLVNENLTNEKVLGLEAGYGFRSAVFNANVNLYHTSWKDRYQRANDADVANPGGYYDFAGITQVHSGVEVDMNAKVGDKLKLNGMFSLGKWVYEGNITGRRFDVNNNNISGGTTTTYFVDGTRVGDVAQMTASLGAAYELAPRFNVDANYRLSDKLFASLDPTKQLLATNKGTLELPSYGLVDAGISYRLLLGTDKSKSLNFRLNINNVLDEVYIAESRTNNFATPTSTTYKGVDVSNQVFFGFGRTWNFTMRYNF